MTQGMPEALERKGSVVIEEQPGPRRGFSDPAGSMRVLERMRVRESGMVRVRVNTCRRSPVRVRRT